MTNKQYENIGRLAEQWLICMDGLEKLSQNLWDSQELVRRLTGNEAVSVKTIKSALARPFAGTNAPVEFFELLRVIISTENMNEIMKEKAK